MPAVKMTVIRDDDNNPIGQFFEPSKTFAESVVRATIPMQRPDSKTVRVNKKLQARGHYDDEKHGFTLLSTKKENAK